jgi:hypothetical protein
MDVLRRITGAWGALAPEQRLAALAALALVATMFLPWYGKSVFDQRERRFVDDSVSAFGAVSFVEAAIFLVAAAVLVLLFLRAEGRAFHLPGGDGTVVTAAGIWATLLIFWRVFDEPDIQGRGATVGIQWGFFLAFVAAGLLTLAGWRLRAAHRPEPPLPQAEPPPEPPTAPVVRRRPTARDDDRTVPGQMSFDEAETHRLRD